MPVSEPGMLLQVVVRFLEFCSCLVLHQNMQKSKDHFEPEPTLNLMPDGPHSDVSVLASTFAASTFAAIPPVAENQEARIVTYARDDSLF